MGVSFGLESVLSGNEFWVMSDFLLRVGVLGVSEFWV